MNPPKLVDLNLLLSLVYGGHSDHPTALNWLTRQDETQVFLIPRPVQIGLLRLLTNGKVMRNDRRTAAQAWDIWDRWRQDPRFVPAVEPVGLETAWRDLSAALLPATIADTDLYLAAFAKAGGYRLATFDKGFHRFLGVDIEFL